MTIYTKKGDKGETGLPGGRRLPKVDQVFETLGNLDQANAFLGLAISFMVKDEDKNLINQLQEVQVSLLGVGACLASTEPNNHPLIKKLPALTKALEYQIDQWNELLPELNNFILPGGTNSGASLHITRTALRQAERSFHRLDDSQKIEEVSIYLNRLSDYFFQAARFYNFIHHQEEDIWAL